MGVITNQGILDKLNAQFPDAIQDVSEPKGLLTFATGREKLPEIIRFLKEDASLAFRFLTDLTGVHYPDRELPLGVVYHLQSMALNRRLRIKAFLPLNDPRIETLTNLFPGANWMERETYDFFGIIFEGHPDLRRILNMDDMVAFPMRKEFPLEDPNRRDKNDDFFGR
ncbi:NADH dehydrogenase subunit C [Anseongella ginsenosidimutans]|uniref:NADH-quinone oxidoreductase subunit C n=1 Tax=Anseongella ginsenosidimutans TaxID=496056 RepID=A0A4R3KUG3_9SPHI|nr:NADH-quinone oxidoreductase subunit C [Anseongella ginsenosidimutans]QEC51690.1 NADH-quinone oxidoreductase subunit C [Anseongella ginsenosidimutans]TCS89047.1 NADH dehydrogenase subunit C [Anseongella ginsenosidimutans]